MVKNFFKRKINLKLILVFGMTFVSGFLIYKVITEPSISSASKHRDFIFIINKDTESGKKLSAGVGSIINKDPTFGSLRIDILQYSICDTIVFHFGTAGIQQGSLSLHDYFNKLMANIFKSSPAEVLTKKDSLKVEEHTNEGLIERIINFIDQKKLLRTVVNTPQERENQKRIAVLLMPFNIEEGAFVELDTLFSKLKGWQTDIYIAIFPPIICSHDQEIRGWENTINSMVPLLKKRKRFSPLEYSEKDDSSVVYRILEGDEWGRAVFSTPDNGELLRKIDLNSLSLERVLEHIEKLFKENRKSGQFQTRLPILLSMALVVVFSLCYTLINSWEVFQPSKVGKWLFPVQLLLFVSILSFIFLGIYQQYNFVRHNFVRRIFLNIDAPLLIGFAFFAALPIFALLVQSIIHGIRLRGAISLQSFRYFIKYATVLIFIAICLLFALIPCTELGQTFYDLKPADKKILIILVGITLLINLVLEIPRLTEWGKRYRKRKLEKLKDLYEMQLTTVLPDLAFKNIEESLTWGNISSRFVRPRGFDLIDFTQYSLDTQIENIDWPTSIRKNRIIEQKGKVDFVSTLGLEYPLIRNFVDERRGEMLALISFGASTILRRQAYLDKKYPLSAVTGPGYAAMWLLLLRKIFIDWEFGCFSIRTEHGFMPVQRDEDDLARDLINLVNIEMASALKHAPDLEREYSFISQLLNKVNPNTDILLIVDDYSIRNAIKIIKKYTNMNRLSVCVWIRDEMEITNIFRKILLPRYGAFESIISKKPRKFEQMRNFNVLLVQSVIPNQAGQFQASIIRELKQLLSPQQTFNLRR